jgi:tetratricopeptide (TPR) repeat protein
MTADGYLLLGIRAAVATCALATGFVDGARAASPNADVRFSRDVAPLLERHCVQCHRPDGPAPFPLTTFEFARRRASQVAAVTRARYMPPWKCVPGYGDFQGKPLLTDAEIAVFGTWAERPQEHPGDRDWVARSFPPGWQLGAPDLVVASGSYTLAADGTDSYQLFVLPVPIEAVRHVRGVEFLPSNATVVHHANILLDATPTSRARISADPDLGTSGGLPVTADYPPGHFLGWVPGQQDVLLPSALAWPLKPGTDLVVQLHLKPSGKPEAVAFRVGFHFQPGPGTETPAMLRLGRQNIDIPAGAAAHVVTDTYELPVDVEVLALKPHAHYRATRVEVVAAHGVRPPAWLLRIDDWDFRWQHVYRLASPVTLPRGSVITTRITYDNSAANPRNPESPPRRVRWGPGSFDEMGDVWIQVRTRDEPDRVALNRNIRRKWIDEDIIGKRTLVANDPSNAGLRTDLGVLLLESGAVSGAIEQLSLALVLRPDLADARVNLGLAMRQAGRVAEAVEQYRAALQRTPDHAAAHYNLANALHDLGQFDEAAAEYREALRITPSHARAHNNLGLEYLRRAAADQALAHFQEATRVDPDLPEAHYNVAHLLHARGDLTGAARALRTAVRLRSDAAGWLAELAWLLATAPDGTVRDGAEALRLAERAQRLSDRPTADILDVLAAAFAETGDYDMALEIVGEAIRIAPSAQKAVLSDREARYRTRRPFRQPLPR